ncbi:sensor histidine kinase [Thalassotalea sp. PLHSN55]|uniref:sensor histidine kinase n=1 Tax=Thalassotalea sp. PLHSN55 TaxID=3435888 RepID=UPI003F82D517
MQTNTKIQSFHRLLLTTIVSFTLVAVITSLTIISLIFINEEKSQLQRVAIERGKIIALMSIEDIKNNDYDILEQKLIRSSALTQVNYIHIYRYSPELDSITFFTSYNRSANHPAIPDKIAQIDNLTTPNISADYIEFIIPIKESNETLGYVYLQVSFEKINSLLKKFVVTIVLISLLMALIAMVITNRLKKQLAAPIFKTMELIQEVSQSKDFSLRSKHLPLREVDILAQNLNILLARVQKHIAKQMQKQEQVEQQNTALENKVITRTDALKESNQELLSTLEKLHQFQNQLVESEKMASLGDMVAGVAHEVNTPIGLGVTASTLLEDNLNEIKTAFENKTLKSSQLKRFLDDGQENVGIIYRNLERAATLISSFKKVAVDQSSEDERSFNVNELLQGVLLSLAPKLNHLPYQVNIDCAKDLTVVSKPGPINQIMINLIMNSVIHGFEDLEQGNINIEVTDMGSQLNIAYTDDGRGIDLALQKKVFDPFTTTKRGSGGSGLGLHLVYNLVTQALGGSIQLENDIAQGVHFEISFPVKEA